MVDSVTFEENLLKIVEQEYNDKVAQKAINGYKKYLKNLKETENELFKFDFKIIEKDVSGKDNDPSKSTLYSILLTELQTDCNDFKTKEDQNKLYSLILSVVNGLLISR